MNIQKTSQMNRKMGTSIRAIVLIHLAHRHMNRID